MGTGDSAARCEDVLFGTIKSIVRQDRLGTSIRKTAPKRRGRLLAGTPVHGQHFNTFLAGKRAMYIALQHAELAVDMVVEDDVRFSHPSK